MSQQRSSTAASRPTGGGAVSAAAAVRRSTPAVITTAAACASRLRRLIERPRGFELGDRNQRRQLAAAGAAHDDLRSEGLAGHLVATGLRDPEQKALQRQLAQFGDTHPYRRQGR